MSCRVARSFRYHTQMETVYCCECGSTHVDVLLTSGTLGPYLCPNCARSMVECGARKDHRTRSLMERQPVG